MGRAAAPAVAFPCRRLTLVLLALCASSTATAQAPIHFMRPVLGESATVRLVDQDDNLLARDIRRLALLLRDRRTKEVVLPQPNLVRVLVQLGRAFPRKTIRIVHGYKRPEFGRPPTRHSMGAAVDLSIEGCGCQQIRRIVNTIRDFGVAVGCFPNASFVHIDVRRVSGFWVDEGVGQ